VQVNSERENAKPVVGFELASEGSKDARERVASLLTALQLDSFADRAAKTYSGGQRRRLDIALGMVNQPQLLFLDEPTTGLDPQSRNQLWTHVNT